MGTEFFISSQTDYANQVNDGSEAFDIVATEDNTVVTITPTWNITGHAANIPFQVVLNKGQTYSARTTDIFVAATLAGSHVVADKPIAVTIFDDSIITGGWDEIADQTIPVNLLGTNYIVIKGFADNVPPGNDDERVYILATKAHTNIMLNGNPVPVATLSPGEQFDYPFPTADNTVAVKSSEPVYVYHLSGHTGEAGSAILPQDSCTGSRRVGFTRTTTNQFAMLILTRNGSQDSFYLNGNNTIITGANFSVVPGTGNSWVYYRQNNLSISNVPQGANQLWNTLGKFHLGILNMGSGGSSEYGYFSDFSSLYLGADRSICPGDSLVLDGGFDRASYEWKKVIAGTWTIIDTTQYLVVRDSGFYACMTNGDFCELRDTIHIGIHPPAIVSLGPDTTICQGTSLVFDPGLYVGYLWQNGGTTRYMYAADPGIYWVEVTNNNGCTARDSVILSIEALPGTPGPVSGFSTVCQGQNGVVYSIDPVQNATSYNWILPSGASGTSTSNTITLDYSTSAISDTLRVWGHSSCGDSPVTKLGITVNPLPGPGKPITGISPVCQGQSGVAYSVGLIENAGEYVWTLPAGATVATGAMTNTITADFGLTTLPGDVTVHGHNSCGDGSVSSFPVSVNLFPLPAGPISGTTPVCQGLSEISYSVPAITGADTYAWSLPPGCLLQSGSGTNSIVVRFDSATAISGDISVTGHSNNCGDGIPSVFTVTVNPLPAPAGVISGPDPVCQGLTGVNFSVPAVQSATSYTWTIPTGVNLVSGVGTNSIITDFTASASSGTISVNGSNSECGNGLTSSRFITVNPLPSPAGAISGPSPVCQGATVQSYQVPPIPDATNYLWSFSGPGATLTNNGNTILADFSVSATSGSFFVTGHNNCGNGMVSAAFPVVINPIPDVSLTICNALTTTDAQPFRLKGGIPGGGTYSGTGVVNGKFYPAVAGAGIHRITYTYTNSATCRDTGYWMLDVRTPLPFTCGNSLTDIRDNSVYMTVTIVSQCWFAEDLRFGIEIPSTQFQRDNCINEKYINPSSILYPPSSVYQWDELMQYEADTKLQGLCPPGWHIPDDQEWNTLFSRFINNGFAGSPLKYSGYSGFNAELSGFNLFNNIWKYNGFATMFWSSQMHGPMKAWAHGMNEENPSVSFYPSFRTNAFSVRCLKD